MKNKIKSQLRIAAMIFILLQLFIMPSMAQITWPAGQILPSFPASAKNQDFIYINGTTPLVEKTWRWEAEGGSIGHNTGRLETDGWLCQTGIDAANQHMVYGPYDNTVTAGPNTAEFRMKVDNNTANNDPIVDIDVRDAATGATLASQTVTRQQFTVAGTYTSFKLPFVMPADNHAIELRVYWRGASYTKVDYVGVQQNNTTPENYLFASLKGIVNRTQPRIFSYEGDAFAEGPFTWLQSLNMTWTEYPDRWQLISKYRSELSGIIVYDPAQNHTVNLATTLAKDRKALVASPSLVARLTAAPYNLPILLDLRGKYNSKLAVYQDLFNNYWPSIDHRLLIGLSPDAHQAAVREYATALGAGVIWLDPNDAAESALLNNFLSSMPAGANFMGWWPEEGSGITRASQYGIATVASDYACNLTMHSGMPRNVNVKPMPPKPTLQNKIYVAFILSDGDNLQYVEHLMRKLWNNPDRGSVPMGWTLSPAMLDAMPGALNFYHQTSTNNDNLISGPSGYGYAYPRDFPNQNSLNQFVAKTEDYTRRAGLRVVTVWNTITGGINPSEGQSYATYAPSLLGLTGQDTGGPLSIYNGTLPGKPLSCNYCSSEQYMKDFIASAASGWNGAQPRFIIIQAQPWTDIKPTNFKNVANSLNSDYIVVRPDHLFMLLREANGLPTNPGGNFNGPVTAYKDCNFTGFASGLDLGDYNLAQLKNLGILDNDISSLKIKEGYKAVLFDGDNFTGATTEITSDMACSGTWNDKTTSLRILPNGVTNMAGTYNLQNRNSSLYMDVWGAGTADGTQIAQGAYNGGTNQQFKFTHLGDGVYQVLAVHSNKSVDIDAISTADGAKVQEWTYFGSDNQKFIVVPTGDGYYKLIAKHSAKVVEVAGASTATGANLQQWTNNNQTCGQWKFKPLTTPGTGTGLAGNYFNGMNFETLKYSRTDANISFDWANGSPNAAVSADQFSARWTGQIQPKYSEEYTFYINSDNGRRVWVNNQLVIDKWVDDYGIEYTGKITLTAGQKYEIKVEYFENNGGANCKLEWSSFIQDREVIPQTQLYVNTLPTISITSPANNAGFTAPASITINATAGDADGSIAKVDFYNGTTLLGADASSPYSFTWTGVAAGAYNITALVTDNRGGVTLSSPVVVSVNQPPAVSITAPANNATYVASANISISATAADADGAISKIEVYNGTTMLGTSTASPYIYNWTNVTAGTYTLTAKAYDNLNAVTTSTAITVIVNANQNPAVSVTVTSTTPNTVNISATANDSDGSITKVDYYDGATKIGTSTATPYNFVWTGASAGNHSITAVATDDKGGTTTSTAVIVTVSNGNQAPTVNITAPANNATYVASANFAITATAADADGTISKIELYNGTTMLGTSTASPYTYNWTNVGVGTYTLTAKAYDNLNAVTTSTAITVKVNANQNPTVSVTATSTTPNTVNISATANDGDGTITKVDYYDGATKIGTSTSSPYNFVWTGASPGNHSITAVATDDKGGTTTSTAVNVTVSNGNQAPTVNITSPVNNASYVAAADIIITATANDADGSISKVEFYNGSTMLGIVTISPFKYYWTGIAAGTYTLTAKAYDNLGLSTTSTGVTITVNVNQNPTVSVTATSTSPNTVNISAAANDGDGFVTKVEFYDGAALIGTSTTAPYNFVWTGASAGTHSITAKVTDDKGGVVTSSPSVVTVNNPNQSPNVSITSPGNNSNYLVNDNITIEANANDADGHVVKVEFYDRNTLLGFDDTAPYSINLNNLAIGTHEITAKAIDDLNASTASASISISVNSATGVNTSVDQNNEISIYPVPAVNTIIIEGAGEEISVEVFNSTGDKILNTNEKILNIINLASGPYLILIHSNGNVFNKVFIKQ